MKIRKLKIFFLSFLIAIPLSFIFFKIENNFIFSKIHFLTNKHFPLHAKCVSYEATFCEIRAKYFFDKSNFYEWVKKYKLKMVENNNFTSKMAKNGQCLTVNYDPKNKIARIRYNPF